MLRRSQMFFSRKKIKKRELVMNRMVPRIVMTTPQGFEQERKLLTLRDIPSSGLLMIVMNVSSCRLEWLSFMVGSKEVGFKSVQIAKFIIMQFVKLATIKTFVIF